MARDIRTLSAKVTLGTAEFMKEADRVKRATERLEGQLAQKTARNQGDTVGAEV